MINAQKTVSIAKQVSASRAIYAKLAEDFASLDDVTASRVLSLVDINSLARIMQEADDSAVARVIRIADGDDMESILSVIDDMALEHIIRSGDEATVDRLIHTAIDFSGDATVARVMRLAGAGIMDRIISHHDSVAAIRAIKLADDEIIANISMEVPVISDMDVRIAEEASKHLSGHGHDTIASCRAGWAVMLGGEAGKTLESVFGVYTAGRLIYEASTGRPAPNFFASDEDAIADIIVCASAHKNEVKMTASELKWIVDKGLLSQEEEPTVFSNGVKIIDVIETIEEGSGIWGVPDDTEIVVRGAYLECNDFGAYKQPLSKAWPELTQSSVIRILVEEAAIDRRRQNQPCHTDPDAG